MRAFSLIESNFWVIFVAGMILGLVAPAFGSSISPIVFPVLMIILYLAYIKIDFSMS
ncbi:MAG: hypothetical protein AAB553_06640 [Patescibacteria group bacterium]